MKRRKITGLIACIVLIACLTGCAELGSALNDLQGDLTGNTYTINTYDNYGNKIMTTQGEKINIEGNRVKTTSYDSDGSEITGYELSSVVTKNINNSTNRVLYHTQPDNIEFPPAAVGGERSGVERRKHRTGEDHQKDGPRQKTNKEIAETTGLKYCNELEREKGK